MDIYRTILPASIMFIAVGAIVLFGWVASIDFLTTPIPGGPSMKFPTALSVMLGGIILRAFYRIVSEERQGESMTRIMGASAILLMMVTPLMGGYFFNIPLHLESLFAVPSSSSALNQALVPSIGTIACILIIFFMSLFAGLGYSISKLSRWGGLALLGIAGMGVLGYLLHNPAMYYLSGRSTGMALHTASSFVLLGFFFFMIGIRPHEHHQPVVEGVTNAPAR